MIEPISGTPFTIQFVLSKLDDDRCVAQNLLGFEAVEITNGSAFMSHVYKLIFNWNDQTIAPKSLILKIPGVQNSNKFEKSCFNEENAPPVQDDYTEHFLQKAHDSEMRFYTHFPKYDAHLKLPKYYYGYEFRKTHNKGLIIMEDLTPKGCTVPMLPGFTDDQMCAVVDELARFNAAAWKNDDWQDRSDINEWKNQGVPFFKKIRSMGRVLQQIKPDWFGELLDLILPHFNFETALGCLYAGEKYGFPSCGVHGDLWSPNVLWKKDENQEATSDLLAIIDWQILHEGNPCEDIGRLLSLNVSSEYRKKNTLRLLKRYHGKISEHFGGKPPCTFEQLLDAYRGSSMYVCMYTVFGAPMYYNMASVVGPDGSAERESLRVELLDRVRTCCEYAASILSGGKEIA